jgi:hypothetical protein
MRSILALLLFAASASTAGIPESPARPALDTLHGVPITDPYRWLEDQDSSVTRAWIEAQMRHYRSFLDEIPRERLKRRLSELQRIDTVGRGWEEPAGPNSDLNRRVEVQWFTIE